VSDDRVWETCLEGLLHIYPTSYNKSDSHPMWGRTYLCKKIPHRLVVLGAPKWIHCARNLIKSLCHQIASNRHYSLDYQLFRMTN
jgi:hypothetical protein